MNLFSDMLANDGFSAPRERKYPVVPPEEQESIIRQALGGLMTGLQWVGEGLDKSLGGRSVRALGFDEAGYADLGNASLSDLAHLIPFSDTLGLTDQGLFGNRLLADKDAVADPTEIRRNYISEDVAPTGNPYLDFIPNLAMDVGVGMALDPATFIVGPGKALSQKGIEAANAGMRAAKILNKYKAGSATVTAAAGSALDKELAAKGLQLVSDSPFMQSVEHANKSRLLGTSPTAIVNEIKAGERGLIGLKLPFMEHPIATLGAGSQTAAKIADMAYYNPLSAGIRQVFDTRVRGTFSPAAQRQADILFSTNENTAARIIQTNLEVERRMGELAPEYDHLVKDWMEKRPDVFGKLSGDLTDPAFMAQMDADQMVRAIGEVQGGQGRLNVMQDLVKQADTAANVKTPDAVMEALTKFDEVASVAREVQDNAYNLYKGLGGEVKHLEDDFVEHFHRRISTELSDLMPGNRQAMKAADGVAGAIHRAIRDVPGGTFKINAMTRDPSITGIGKPTTDMLLDNIQATNGVQRDVAESMLLNMDEKDVGKLAKSIQDARLQANASKLEQTYGIERKPVMENGVQVVDPKTGLPVFEEIPLETARWLASLPTAVLEKGLFGRSFVTDMTAYATSMMRRANGLNAVHNLFAEVATDDPDTIGRSVAEIYGQAGNNRRWRDAQGKWHASKDRGLLNLTPEGTNTFASRYAAKKGLNAADVDANNLVVPESMVNAAERMMHYNTNPGDATGLLGAYDSIMRIYKNSIYTPWPASHVRNGISGLWQNMVTAFKNPGSGIKAMNEAKNALMGKGNKQYVQEFKAYGLISSGMLNDIERYAATEIPSLYTLGQAAKDYTLGSVDNLFHPIQTIKGTKRPGPVLAGQKIGEVVEFVNRYSHFSALRERGWSPAAAARSVKLSHFDYADITETERQLFKRIAPFYTFARKNLPAQLRALIDEPGGRTAQTIRAYNIGREQSREKQSYVPSKLGSGLVIPIGQQQGDTQNFFVSRGLLPVEEAFNRFPMMQQSILGLTDEAMLPDPKYTAENIGSMTTLAPLGQYMSGRQWWSHRKLGDLYQDPTGNDAVNFMLYNGLPTSRAVSQIRQLTDERKEAWQKAFNALVGGAYVSSVDMPRARNIEARELLSRHLEPMAGIREGSYLFAPDISKLDEDTIEQLSTLQQIMAQQTKLNKERAKAK